MELRLAIMIPTMAQGKGCLLRLPTLAGTPAGDDSAADSQGFEWSVLR